MIEMARRGACATRSSPRSGTRRTRRGCAAGGTRPARQGARRRRRGRRGHLPRRRRRDRRRVGALRRRPRRGGRQRPGAAAGRRPGPQPLAGRAVRGQPRAPGRRRHRADHRRRRRGRRRDPPRPRVGSARRHPHPVDVAAAPAVPRRPLRPGLGGVRGARHAGARALGRRRHGSLRRARRHLRHRGAVVVGPPAVVPASGPACSSASRGCGSASPSAVRSGRTTCSGRWTSSTTASTARRSSARSSPRTCRCGRASTSTATASIGASNTRRRELARRYEIGVGNIMWGNDFPHPEGTWPHTREWLRKVFCDLPVDETRAMLGGNAATSTASTSTRSRRSPTASARRPTSSARPATTSRSGPTSPPPAGRGSPASATDPSPPHTNVRRCVWRRSVRTFCSDSFIRKVREIEASLCQEGGSRGRRGACGRPVA